MHDVHIRTWDRERATPDTPTPTHMYKSKHTHSQHTHNTHRYTHLPTLQTQEGEDWDSQPWLRVRWIWIVPECESLGSSPYHGKNLPCSLRKEGWGSALVHSLLSRSLKVEGHVYSEGLKFSTGCPYSLCRVPSNRCMYTATFQASASQNNSKQKPAHFHLPIAFLCARSVRKNSNKPGYQA